MVKYGLYLPDYFKHQHYDNFYDVPFEKQDGNFFVNLEYFRELYKENKSIFNQISKELVFRGGEFFLEKESPLFPKITFENNELITLEDTISEDAFKKIDYDVYGIQQFVKMFNINNNQFFDHVPLEGFKVLNLSNISLLYLKKKLVKSGFSITQYNLINERKSKQARLDNNSNSTKANNTFKVEEIQNKNHIKTINGEILTCKIKPNYNEIKNSSRKLTLNERKMVISRIGKSNFKRLNNFLGEIMGNPFFRNMFIEELNLSNKTKQVFITYGIYNISQINEDNIIEVLNEMESSEIKEVVKVLDYCLLNHNLIGRKVVSFINKNPSIKNYPIDSLLNENSYNKFKNNAYHLGLRELGDFTLSKTIGLLRSDGVGKTKIYNFTKELFSLNTNSTSLKLLSKDIRSEPQEDSPVYFAYGFVGNRDIRQYIKGKKISFISKSEIVEIIKYKAKNNKDKKILISSLEKSIDYFEKATEENLMFSNDYRLTIKEILEILDIEFASNQLKEKHLLTKPIYQNTDNFDDFSSNLKQIIFLYKNSIEFFRDLKESPSELFYLDERETIIYDLRIKANTKETLDSIATKIGGLTRERVRQIESKVKRKVKSMISSEIISLYIEHLEKNNIYTIQDKQLINILNSLEIESVYYNEFFDIAVHNKYKESLETIETNLYELTKTKDFFPLQELVDYLYEQRFTNSEHIIKLLISNLEYYLTKLEYTIRNNTVVKEKVSKVRLYTFTIEKYYSQEAVDFSNEVSLNLFLDRLQKIAPQNMLNDLRGRDRNDLIRSIEAVLDRNNKKVLKLNAHEYKLLNANALPYGLIDDMYKYVKDQILENSFVAVKKVFWKHENKLAKSGFTEKTVYSILKLLFEEEFDFTGKTTLRIFEKGAYRKTTKEIITSLLEKYNGDISMENLSREMGVEAYTLYQHNNNDYYILDGRVYLNDSELNLSKNTVETIKNVFNNILSKKNYVPVKQVFDEIRFSGNINNDLKENNFVSTERFIRLLKQLFPDTEGHTRILFKKGNDPDYLSVFLNEMTDSNEFYRDDFYVIGKELGFADVTINLYINDFIDCNKIVPLNNDKFIAADSLYINKKVLSSIDKFLKEYFNKENYLSLSVINHELYKLPQLDEYTWTVEILNYIAIKYLKYQKIIVNESHYTNDPLIIKHVDSNLTYRDIIAIEMQDFDDIRTEDNVLQFLIERGLLRSNTRSIYKWFFNKKIFIKNDFERIYLAEEASIHE